MTDSVKQQCKMPDCVLSKFFHNHNHPNCSYGNNIHTPPVNESWEVEFQKEMMLLCWEIEKLPASEQQTKTVLLAGKIKDNLKKFFGEQSTLLSTARQEERENIRELFIKAIVSKNPLPNGNTTLVEVSNNLLDSLTSKGGTND